ncbi:hypothetical protein [Rhodonellum sp.]|uniref:hypothetical protein n=1 Tax=Rhodonellum sp. TaxID=2231180 RepID=UPI0027252C5D|nr:hypothetical protein [Rhodonellum sp.]MDO9553061.1 hypothetical protein [Rhodonellum sp.]
MILKKIILLIYISIVSHAVESQTSYDLIAVDIKKSGSKIAIIEGTELKITDRKEYDNQPDFINEKQLAFSAADENGNHDIIIYNFESGKFTNLTKTPNQSEYSPSITDCGLFVSAITVEQDGKQRLWLYPTNFGEPELLYDDILPVGYYDWYDNKAAMFVLGQPNQFVYPYSKSEILTISQNIGRSIQKRPKSSIVAFVDKNDTKEIAGEKAFAIKGFDLEKRIFENYGYTLPGAEDFIWLDKNLLLMGKGNALFVRKANQEDWESSGFLQIKDYQNISRMAFSAKLKKLVVVMERK